MVITLFFSRFREDLGEQGLEEYLEDAKEMRERAETFPGFHSIKTYSAEDGERLTVVNFDSPEHHGAWAADPVHLEAQQRGREKYYREYRLIICGPDREYSWEVGRTLRGE